MALGLDFEESLKALAEDGLIGGVQLCVPTGKVLDTDTTYIEVLIYGKSVFAKPCMAFGSYNVPDEQWLEKYKDEVLVWVAFENGNPAHPVYLGVCPMDGKSLDGSYPRKKVHKTTEFAITSDDDAGTIVIDKLGESEPRYSITLDKELVKIADASNNLTLDFSNGKLQMVNADGQGIILKEHTVLGKGSAEKSAVLGETLNGLISESITETSNALTTLSTATVIVNPSTFIGIFNPAVITGLQTAITKLIDIQSRLETALSKNVKLD